MRPRVVRTVHMTERFAGALAALLVLTVAPTKAAGPEGREATTSAAAASAASQPALGLVDDGRRRYTGLCVRCHGLNLATNGIGFDLRTFPRDGKERFSLSVRRGLRAMPSFESIITENDVDALWAYIGMVNGWSQ